MSRKFFLLRSISSDLKRRFQRADGLADGGLRDLVDLRSLSEAFRFDQVAEHLQAFDLHKRIKWQNSSLVNRRYRSFLQWHAAGPARSQFHPPPIQALTNLFDLTKKPVCLFSFSRHTRPCRPPIREATGAGVGEFDGSRKSMAAVNVAFLPCTPTFLNWHRGCPSSLVYGEFGSGCQRPCSSGSSRPDVPCDTAASRC